MTKDEKRLKLICEIANGVAIKNGVDKNELFLDQASEAIVKLADAILSKMEE